MKCGFETKADNKEQLMKSIATHAKEAHNINKIAPDLMMKVNAAIKQAWIGTNGFLSITPSFGAPILLSGFSSLAGLLHKSRSDPRPSASRRLGPFYEFLTVMAGKLYERRVFPVLLGL
jgi:predicted small metal-binding protein